MIVNHRPSILKRPLRPNGNLANQENQEKEYLKEQSRIRSHATWQADTQERMRKTFYAGPGERQEMQQEMAGALEQQLAAKQSASVARAAAERDCFPANHTAPVPQDRARPWAATTQQLTPAEEAAARHQASAHDAEVNRHAIATRAVQEQQQRLQERRTANHNHQAEDSYWNRGAASARWVPPEHRPRGNASQSHPPPKPAPYTWNEEAAPRPRTASAAPRMPAPYSTQDDVDAWAAAKPAREAASASGRKAPSPFWTQDDSTPAAAPRPRTAAPADRTYPWTWNT